MNKGLLIILAIAVLITTTASKCKKETPPKAVVLVVDEQNRPLAGATVKVYSDPTLYDNNYPPQGYFDPDEKNYMILKLPMQAVKLITNLNTKVYIRFTHGIVSKLVGITTIRSKVMELLS